MVKSSVTFIINGIDFLSAWQDEMKTSLVVDWEKDPYLNRWLEIAYEIVYYNGTAYNKIVQPFQLNIVGREET